MVVSHDDVYSVFTNKDYFDRKGNIEVELNHREYNELYKTFNNLGYGIGEMCEGCYEVHDKDSSMVEDPNRAREILIECGITSTKEFYKKYDSFDSNDELFGLVK